MNKLGFWRFALLFFAGYGIGTIIGRAAVAPAVDELPPLPANPPMAVDGPEDPILQRLVQRIVDRRMDEHRQEFQPTDEEMERAMRAAMKGEMSADMGAGGWFALAIAKAVWKAFRLAVRVALIEDLVSLARSWWYYLAAGVAALAGWIEWRARSAAARLAKK